MISECAGEDEDHGELEEGFVGLGFTVAADVDAASVSQPAVGAFDWPAVAGEWVAGLEPAFLAAPDLAHGGTRRDRLAAAAGPADPWLDPALAQLAFELGGVVAAIGPQLGRLDAAPPERVEQGQQVASFVLVARGEPHRQRQPGRLDG